MRYVSVERQALNGATLLLLRDLRAWGAPVWVGRGQLTYLRWRVTLLEWRYGLRDDGYTARRYRGGP